MARKEGEYTIEIERHYFATIKVDASSEAEAKRYAFSDENQHIANRNEEYFEGWHEETHEAKVVRYQSYEELYPDE